MLLELTWCHRTPADTPTRIYFVSVIQAISNEHQLDDVACASYGSRQGVVHPLASNNNAASRGGRFGEAAAFLHQGCPVPFCDCQVVVVSVEVHVNVKCSEM